MAHNFKVGDWVRIHKAGIWQIYRVIAPKCLDPLTQKETVRDIIFAKRFLNNSFKKSFGEDSCHPDLAKKLSASEQKQVDSHIANNPKQYEQFLEYAPQPIDSIYNARIEAPTDLTPEQVYDALSSDRKLTQMEIGPFLESKGFQDGLPCWTIQCVSRDHECDQDGYLIYSISRILPF